LQAMFIYNKTLSPLLAVPKCTNPLNKASVPITTTLLIVGLSALCMVSDVENMQRDE